MLGGRARDGDQTGWLGVKRGGRCSRGTGGKVAVRRMWAGCTRTYDKTAKYAIKPGSMTHENE